MKVIPVPVRQDNYAYLLVDEPSNKAAAVDPFDVPRVAAAAERLGVSIIPLSPLITIMTTVVEIVYVFDHSIF